MVRCTRCKAPIPKCVHPLMHALVNWYTCEKCGNLFLFQTEKLKLWRAIEEIEEERRGSSVDLP